jgi:hypothetical protein
MKIIAASAKQTVAMSYKFDSQKLMDSAKPWLLQDANRETLPGQFLFSYFGLIPRPLLKAIWQRGT